MEFSEENINVISVVRENDVLIPVALRWKYWIRNSGGRKIVILPMKGIVVQKVKKSIGTRERRSSVKLKQRQPDQQNWHSKIYKARQPSYRDPSEKYNIQHQAHVSETNLSAASSKESLAPPCKSARPYLWSTKETIDSKIGAPSPSREPREARPGQGDRIIFRKTSDPKIGAHSPSREPREARPGQGDRIISRKTSDSKIGAHSPSRETREARPGEGGKIIGSPSTPRKQPERPVGGTVNKSTSSGSAQPKSNFSQFEKECLDEHNKYRAIHGVPPLTLSRNLCNYAQEWANHLVELGGMEHRTEGKYGENLYMSAGLQKVDARLPVKSWYDEIQFYTYGSDFSPNTGHFTQVVWKGSKEMGCAFAQKGHEIYVVANYNPPGNFQGEFSANVLPPKN